MAEYQALPVYHVDVQWRGDMAAHVLWIWRENKDGREVLTPDWKTPSRHGLLQQEDLTDALVFEPHEFRALMQQIVDAAWEQGIKPTRAQDTAGVIERLEDHLQDMRSLVFEPLDRKQSDD